MNEHKKARSSEATPERAEAGAETGQATIPTDDCITATNGRQMRIAGFLSHGADHGLHLTDLVRLTGLPERTVRAMVHQERRQHIPILSNNRDGYFLPGSEHEKAACVRSLRRRAAEIVEAADGIERAVVADG